METLIYGQKVWLDEEDAHYLKEYTFKINKKGYATSITTLRLHRVIMNVTDKNIMVDHINGNPLDNRRCNLRVTSAGQNGKNRKVNKNNTSGISGVHKDGNSWQARIRINEEIKYLGNFNNKWDAIRARKNAEQIYYKEFTRGSVSVPKFDSATSLTLYVNGNEVLIDKSDEHYFNEQTWTVPADRKSVVAIRRADLHKLILGNSSKITDHINGIRSDNRKSNLRLVTPDQNHFNMSKFKNNTSGTPGVYWHTQSQRWRAQININRKATTLGNFKTKEEAIKAREVAEIKFFGEHGRTVSLQISPPEGS